MFDMDAVCATRLPGPSDLFNGQTMDTAKNRSNQVAYESDGALDKKRQAAHRKGLVTSRTPRSDSEAAQMRDVFAHWQTMTGYRRHGLTGPRRRLILSRLRAGYTVEQLRQIIDWAVTDRWMTGQHPDSPGPFLGLETLLRSNGRVDEYLIRSSRHERHSTSTGRGEDRIV